MPCSFKLARRIARLRAQSASTVILTAGAFAGIVSSRLPIQIDRTLRP
jgi:hypothetical protein